MNYFRILILRFAVCILLLTMYLFLWRPVRAAITRNLISPALKHAEMKESANTYSIEYKRVALRITFDWGHQQKTIQYRPQAGFFFLISLMILVMISADYKYYFGLSSLHLFMTFVTAGLMLLSKNGWFAGFILVDFIVSYLAPMISLAYAVWAVAGKKT